MYSNKRIPLICLLAPVLLIFAGCKKYLELKPKGVDIATSIDHYNGLFNSILLASYSTSSVGDNGAFSLGVSANLSILMGDEVVLADPFSNALPPSSINAFNWERDIYLPDEDASEWATFYIQNYTYNVIIDGVMDAPDGTPEQKKELLAEARVCRALMHFMVVNHFGKPYDNLTSATDPGVPIITKPDAPAMDNKRATVKEVYDFVLAELNASVADLPEKTASRFRLAGAGGKFIIGQVYFTMGNYQEALPYLEAAKQLLTSSSIPLRLYDYNVKMDEWAPFLPGYSLSMPNASINEEAIFQKQINTKSNIFLDPAQQALYTEDDQRLKMFTNKAAGTNTTYPYLTRNSPYSVNIGPSVPNLYLMLAECKARTDDVNGAITDLETLRKNRMPAASAKVNITDKNELIRFIVDERIREYACTGMRWFDIRRLWNDPLFADKTYWHTLPDGSKIQLVEERLALKVPPRILSFNPSMDPNP